VQRLPEPVRAAAVVPSPPAVEAPTATGDATACDDAFRARRWRAMAEPCAAAYAATPTATLALRAAQSHHARGQLADAGIWAKRALAIDPTRAEAFVLVARAATHAGDARSALRAYRRYLSVAPRGWHADEALTATAP
jgi:tetratricopeptide (TPR) repeat protein